MHQFQNRHQDRRLFSRIEFHCASEIRRGGQRWAGELQDISLASLRIGQLEKGGLHPGDRVLATLHLSSGLDIKVAATLRRWDGSAWAMEYDCLDLDSGRHLRRLLELNLGNSDQILEEYQEMAVKHRLH